MLLALLMAILLPTGKSLDPAGRAIRVGNLPLAMVSAPGGQKLLVLLSGWRHQGIQVVDIASGNITQTVEINSSFLGLAISDRTAAGTTVFASGANDNVV